MNCFNPDKPDATFPFLEADMGRRPESMLLDASTTPLPEFKVRDEWILVQRVGGVPSPIVSLISDSGDLFNAGEPFFVSGANTFQIQASSGQFVVTRAARRELLSWSPNFANNGDANSPGFSLVQSIPALNLAYSSGANWIYLDANLAWQQAVIGDIGAASPFGWAAASSRGGRYYDFAYQFESSVGTLAVYIVHRIGTARPAFPIFVGPTGVTGNSGIIHVGDDSPTSPLGGYPSAGHAQVTVLGSNSWTIAVLNNVAATITGTLSVIRRGF